MARQLSPATITGVLAAYSLVMTVTAHGAVYGGLFAFVAVQNAWVSGMYLGQYLTVARVRDATEVPQREALLARLEQSAGAYPNLLRLGKGSSCPWFWVF